MNYTTPTFQFQPDDELCFNVPSTSDQPQYQQHIIPDMLIGPPPSMVYVDPIIVKDHQMVQINPPNEPATDLAAPHGGEEKNGSGSNKKKIIHRDIERHRRHEMGMLYSALRSQLPTECLKATRLFFFFFYSPLLLSLSLFCFSIVLGFHFQGKRSISDHMNEAAKYIKHKQEKIQRLTERRDALRRAISSSPSDSNSSQGEGSLNLPTVTVQPGCMGVEVSIGGGPEDGLRVSSLIEALVQEGLDVVSLVSTKINEKSFYALQCKVGNLQEVDFCGLKEKLLDTTRYSD